jgi:hypothetical protein
LIAGHGPSKAGPKLIFFRPAPCNWDCLFADAVEGGEVTNFLLFKIYIILVGSLSGKNSSIRVVVEVFDQQFFLSII